ncbi:MAG: HAD family phosphatase [Thermodesulfobacteriota bacterium]|nr:HAD family phosphatase [Thermodesulfobacteriota bacterium]
MRLSGDKRVEALIFDLDGVILDSMASHVAAWQTAFFEAGLDVSADFIYLHEGALDRERICVLLGRAGQRLEPEAFDRARTRQREIYIGQYADKVRVFPQAAGLISRLSRAGMELALVTSSTRRVLSPGLLSWLEKHFCLLVTGDQVQRTKPDPEPYLTALAGLGLEPNEALVVENAPAGIKAARRAGLACVALATTLPPSELAEADRVLPDHDALTDLLEQELSPWPAVILE